MAEDKPGTPTPPEGTPKLEETTPTTPTGVVHEIKPGEILTFAGQGGMNIDETFPSGIAGLKPLPWHPLTYPSGLGGRPSSRARVREEAMRRLYHNRQPEKLRAFRAQLSEWLEGQFDEELKQVPQMKPRTVELNIEDLWNAWHRCRGCPTGPVD